MQFVHPFFLFGLLAVAIPLLIHLFNLRRYRKIYFSNVRFIKQVRQETRRHSQLRHILVLISRMLAIIFLVVAFAQPYIPADNIPARPNARNAVSIYVDNSFSMEAVSGSGTLLEQSKKMAGEIVEAFRSTDVFHLITNDLYQNRDRLLSRDEFLEVLNEVSFTPVSRDLSEIYRMQQDVLESENTEARSAFLLSDFQKSVFDLKPNIIDTQLSLYLLPQMARQTNNVFIDSCWFQTPVLQPGSTLSMYVSLTNGSDEDLEKIPVRLIINGQQRGLSTADIQAKSTSVIGLPFSVPDAGWKKGRLEISDYPVTYDDLFYFTFQVHAQTDVLSIFDEAPNPYLRRLFEQDSAFKYHMVDARQINYAMLQDYPVIILEGIEKISSGLGVELKKFLLNGGTLVLFPAKEMDLRSYNAFLREMVSASLGLPDTVTSTVSSINLNHPVFNEVFEETPDFNGAEKMDMPHAYFHYPVRTGVQTLVENLMTLQNNDPFLFSAPVEEGRLFCFTSPLSGSGGDFFRHALFVPVMYRMAMLSNKDHSLFQTIGSGRPVYIPESYEGKDKVFTVRYPETDREFIPETGWSNGKLYIAVHDRIREAGIYDVYYNDAFRFPLAYNYDRKESSLDAYNENEIKEILDVDNQPHISLLFESPRPVSQTINELSQGVRLWKLFVIFALIFLLAEAILLRFLR